ncbi:MAG TPA: hypothetical protein VGW10_07750 [Solirubrobacteraceae bacterium]|nr:hypothetical protein [Solirubrobacteraceae bacterium]
MTPRIPLHAAAMDELQPIVDALRSSVTVDDATWSVFVDALADSLLLGAQVGAHAVLAHAEEEDGIGLDVELDLLPAPGSDLL